MLKYVRYISLGVDQVPILLLSIEIKLLDICMIFLVSFLWGENVRSEKVK